MNMIQSVVLIVAVTVVSVINANAGRWLSRDPIQEGQGFVQRDPIQEGSGFVQRDPNLYVFVENNGVSYIDPFGLATLRFEVVVGTPSVWSYSGKWSQPSWAGNGDYGGDGGSQSAWSTVMLNNDASFFDNFHFTPDYCNTVQVFGPIGTKGDAGSIRVYAKDDCGGVFHISGFYSASLTGSGPNPGYGYAVLTVDGSMASSVTISPKSPVAMPQATISKDITLKAKQEKLVVEYRPTLALKNRAFFGGVPADVRATALVFVNIK